MRPDVLVHLADRIAQIGAYEGLWWRQGTPDDRPDAMTVRLDDGTRAHVVGRCVRRAAYLGGRWEYGIALDEYQQMCQWTADGHPAILAVHDHARDTLHWGRIADMRHRISTTRSGSPRAFFPRDAFTVESCETARI